MNGNPCEPDDSLQQALDAALHRALPAPALPAGFRKQVFAAMQQAEQDKVAARQHLEAEHRLRLTEIEGDYRRMRRRALLDLTGGAIVAAALLAIMWPLIAPMLGPDLFRGLTLCAALACLLAGVAEPWRRLDLGNPLEQF